LGTYEFLEFVEFIECERRRIMRVNWGHLWGDDEWGRRGKMNTFANIEARKLTLRGLAEGEGCL
jgi:ABC-type phosphonate transport system ATPase subunit